ncbi:MAG: GNAT family N-acetyltransferase [Phototrophicaceae bacterium]
MQQQLEDGLILRSLSEGVASDRERLPDFYVEIFTEAEEEDAGTLGPWTRDLISDAHPTVTDDDIWVVVDPAAGDKIVSALLLIPQTWRYGGVEDGVEFGVGRVELVATDKAYRRRGLVRKLMNVAHQRSAELGHLMQVITGIPHYYRQFGYAMAVNLGFPGVLPLASIPALPADQEPKFTLRPASDDDIPNLLDWSHYYARECLLSVAGDETIWRFELNQRTAVTPHYQHVRIITRREDGQDVGFVSLRASDYGPFLGCYQYGVGEESSYLETFADVMREIKAFAETRFADRDDGQPSAVYFESGVHPTVETLVRMYPSGTVRDSVYAWYIRVPDLAEFSRRIAPVLERRLAGSGANRFTGTLGIVFQDFNGLLLTFTDGRLTEAANGDLPRAQVDAAFPWNTFLNVMLGHRSVTEIDRVLPETFCSRKAAVLLPVLFPVQRSNLIALV